MKLRRLARFALLALPLAGAAAPMSVAPLAAATAPVTFTVGSPLDLTSPDCNVVATCSLREAVRRAKLLNNNSVVQLQAMTYTLTIAPGVVDDNSGGDLEIFASMTIQGAGAGQSIVTAGSAWNDRIMEVDNGGLSPVVTIQDLTVTGGNTQQTEGDGGGILNDNSTLTLHNVVVDRNTAATNTNGPLNGGGIASEAGSTLTMTNSTISNNNAFANGGGLVPSRPGQRRQQLLQPTRHRQHG